MVKSWLGQDQTVLGKDYSNLLIANSFAKKQYGLSMHHVLAMKHWLELTIPEQTATGKGISNPLMAGSLPKTTKPTYNNDKAGSPTHNDLGDCEEKISYEECEKIYAEAVIFFNNRLVRLIDVTVEQWLDLKYGNHMTMDVNVKKEVISTWLIRSYKLQFEEYLEIMKQRDTYIRDVDMKYDPSNLVFR
ncbi:hypothetical protein Tco_1392131 [Tanacetum coccineum]